MSTMIPVSGNTYPVKEKLKALGGRWNPDRRCWMIPEEHADKAYALVQPALRRNPAPVNSYRRSNGRCRAPGCQAIAVDRGYCRSCAFDEFDD